MVWVVDDSQLESSVARDALASQYEVRNFHDGSAALEELASAPLPDVLVLDWVMPGLSGIEICQFLRSRPACAELPILLLTVQQNTAQIVEGLGAGANDYLGKPYAAPELRARVGALIRSAVLRERAERTQAVLRRVLGQLPDAVLTIDQHQRVVFANAEAERLLAADLHRLGERPLPEVLPDLQLDAMLAPGAVQRQASLPDVRYGDAVLSPRVSIPPADDEGNTTITLRDVTEARRTEARRVDFYSMVAHDLRSPLSAMLMRIGLLQQERRGPIGPEIRHELDRMHGGVRELVRMINDFLDVAQLETGHFRLEREPVDLRVVVAAAVEEFRPLADARQLQISEAGGAAPVVGDPRRLLQVVANLLSNAIKFTPRGGNVRIRVAAEADAVQLEVEDDGPGIPAASQPLLFRKYERVEGSAAGRVEGTGLGLVIVKEIVEAHGGTVGLRSSAGAGSTFWLRLPAEARVG